ncbi:hypothetical protein CIB48_g10491 [Xylaria polymorpha]|nr:hypothetical protein CIB48_g10491 [Xylaria polymorpha]
MLFKMYSILSVPCPQGWSTVGIFAFSLSLFLLMPNSNGVTADEMDRRHRANADLLAKGQLTLDLFPPLSYLFATATPVSTLRPVIVAARLISINSILHKLSKEYFRRWWWVTPTYIFLQPSPRHTGLDPTPLDASAAVASSFLMLSVLSLQGSYSTRMAWAGQTIVILAGMLGCNATDWVLCYATVPAQDLCFLFSPEVSRSSRQLVQQLCLAICRTGSLPLLIHIAVYGLIYPFSETSAGYNHNLRFLDASARRALSPQQLINLESLGLHQHAKNIPAHALIPFLPLSLYVPKAGFLWGDTDETGDPLVLAYFADPMGHRYPWAFEQSHAPGDEELNEEQRSFVQSHLWPKELVYLRSRIDQMYLGTAAFLNPDESTDESEPFYRFPLGMHSNKSAATVWILDYDPKSDAGFRLYNPHNDCYLATTFRPSEHHQGGGGSDDLLNSRARSTLGASCTRLVNRAASTFWIIEGSLKHTRSMDPVYRWKALPPPFRACAHSFRKGYSIFRAHVSLYRWQSRYELSPSPFLSSRIQDSWAAQIEQLVVFAFLACHSSFLLISKRTGRRLPGGLSTLSPALICWTHIIVYSILGYRRPHGNDVELMMALYGLGELLIPSGNIR